jgi:ABC-type glycerol-3-phosphate transport system substrate-binding protein
MRKLTASSLLSLLFVTGCGGPAAPLTDATKIPPLTAEQLETIKKTDSEVENEEGGEFQKVKAKFEAKAKAKTSR